MEEQEHGLWRSSSGRQPLAVAAFLAHSVQDLSVEVNVRLFCVSKLTEVVTRSAGQKTDDVSVTPEQSHVSSRLTRSVRDARITSGAGQETTHASFSHIYAYVTLEHKTSHKCQSF